MNDTDDLEVQRKRLRFRSWHRGMKEMDLLMGGFADRYLAEFDGAQLATFELLLRQSDTDLYNWVTGAGTPPAELESDVLRLLLEFKITATKD